MAFTDEDMAEIMAEMGKEYELKKKKPKQQSSGMGKAGFMVVMVVLLLTLCNSYMLFRLWRGY